LIIHFFDKMPSIAQVAKLALLSAVAVQAAPKFNNARPREFTIEKRQDPAAAPAPQLTDTDILNFALTLEHLESQFYSQGFAKFPDSDFLALGLTQPQLDAVKNVGMTEQAHEMGLTMAISAAGAQPVQACKYNFGFTDAKTMIATAKVLEAVGISAYTGAAALIQSKAVLTAAAEILPIEARHQTTFRAFTGEVPVPNALETPLGVRAVFTLASPFIQSCPQGSNLAITPFPAIALNGGAAGITAGQSLILADPSQPAGAGFCAFMNVGSTTFVPISNGSCNVPDKLTGEVYMMVTKDQSTEDASVLAGPTVIRMSG